MCGGWRKGSPLVPMWEEITQEKINRYARAARDYNPIHVDEEYGRKSAFGSTIAHGFLLVGYLSKMLRQNFENAWLADSFLSVRFHRPAKPGDVVQAGGEVSDVEGGVIDCAIWLRNEAGENLITGTARLKMQQLEEAKK